MELPKLSSIKTVKDLRRLLEKGIAIAEKHPAGPDKLLKGFVKNLDGYISIKDDEVKETFEFSLKKSVRASRENCDDYTERVKYVEFLAQTFEESPYSLSRLTKRDRKLLSIAVGSFQEWNEIVPFNKLMER